LYYFFLYDFPPLVWESLPMKLRGNIPRPKARINLHFFGHELPRPQGPPVDFMSTPAAAGPSRATGPGELISIDMDDDEDDNPEDVATCPLQRMFDTSARLMSVHGALLKPLVLSFR
jgi:hypothetical protein